MDTVLHGATILDGSGRPPFVGTVGIVDGRIAAVHPGRSTLVGAESVQLDGLVLTPGLIDAHAHVIVENGIGLDVDAASLVNGVTAVVDAGSAGAPSYATELVPIAARSRVEVLGLVNLSDDGLANAFTHGELRDPRSIDVPGLAAVLRTFPDIAPGIKVRCDTHAMGEHYKRSLDLALRAATESGRMLMVHIGDAPWSVDAILERLRPGDVVTHMFTGRSMRLAGTSGAPRPAALDARARGVRFDVGHGAGGFDVSVARSLIAAGFLPDTLGTDLHTLSAPIVVGMTVLISKLLALGIELPALIAMASAQVAEVYPQLHGRGTIEPGSPADLAVFENEDRAVTFTDSAGVTFTGTRSLRHRFTYRAGRLVAQDGGLL